MNITIEKVENSTVFKLDGRLDTTTAPELEKAINNEDALENLVLDFAGKHGTYQCRRGCYGYP